MSRASHSLGLPLHLAFVLAATASLGGCTAGVDADARTRAGLDAAAHAADQDPAEVAVSPQVGGGNDGATKATAAMNRDAAVADQPSLLVETTGVATTGRQLKIRVSVTNTLSEKVSGVRYFVRLRGGQERVLDTIRQESDVEIEPGGRIMGRLDVSSVYVGGKVLFFEVLAFPVRIGTREMPVPKLRK